MTTDNKPVLVFVYNADAGLLNKLKDALHKTFSPNTYPCSLCDITYSPMHMRYQWRMFVKDLPFDVEFTYRNAFAKEYGIDGVEHPSAWLKTKGTVRPWLTASQINNCTTLESLQALVLEKLPT